MEQEIVSQEPCQSTPSGNYIRLNPQTYDGTKKEIYKMRMTVCKQ